VAFFDDAAPPPERRRIAGCGLTVLVLLLAIRSAV
jgi:hypothetical protein